MDIVQIGAIGATITRLITIICSAFAGSASILLLRRLHERRVLFGALHTELVDNYMQLEDMEANLEVHDNNPKMVFLNETFRNSGLEAIRVNDPGLYISLDSEVDALLFSHRKLSNLETFGEPSLQSSPTVKISMGNQKKETHKGSQIVEEEAVENHIRQAKMYLTDAIEGLENYSTQTRFRRILYRGVILPFDDMGTESEEESTDSSTN